MLALRLPPEIEKRLRILAKKTGPTTNSHACEAIRRHVESWKKFTLPDTAFPGADHGLHSKNWRTGCDSYIFG